MGNTANYFGLRPVKHINGSSWNGLTEKCYVGATYAPLLYIGDPVMINNALADSDATALHTSVELSIPIATTAAPIYGVITSICSSEDIADKWVKKPASTEAYVNVCVDPTVIYHIRDDGLGAPAATWPFLNAWLIQAAAGNALTGLSGVALDGANVPATTQTFPVTIIRLANLPDNDMADNAIWEVLINTHQLLNGGVAGNVLGVAKG